jgi:hypothetical protein
MTQQTLFDDAPPTPGPPAQDRERLGRQCQAVLDRLRRGPTSNYDLALISLKYTSRISDLRAKGYTITATEQGQGLFFYTLEGSK